MVLMFDLFLVCIKDIVTFFSINVLASVDKTKKMFAFGQICSEFRERKTDRGTTTTVKGKFQGSYKNSNVNWLIIIVELLYHYNCVHKDKITLEKIYFEDISRKMELIYPVQL